MLTDKIIKEKFKELQNKLEKLLIWKNVNSIKTKLNGWKSSDIKRLGEHANIFSINPIYLSWKYC